MKLIVPLSRTGPEAFYCGGGWNATHRARSACSAGRRDKKCHAAVILFLFTRCWKVKGRNVKKLKLRAKLLQVQVATTTTTSIRLVGWWVVGGGENGNYLSPLGDLNSAREKFNHFLFHLIFPFRPPYVTMWFDLRSSQAHEYIYSLINYHKALIGLSKESRKEVVNLIPLPPPHVVVSVYVWTLLLSWFKLVK